MDFYRKCLKRVDKVLKDIRNNDLAWRSGISFSSVKHWTAVRII